MKVVLILYLLIALYIFGLVTEVVPERAKEKKVSDEKLKELSIPLFLSMALASFCWPILIIFYKLNRNH